MTKPTEITEKLLAAWGEDPHGPVALVQQQPLRSVDGCDDAVIFPPTYADIGYNIDTLSDGRRVATIDSVGSQANRMEPLFLHEPLSHLVPKLSIALPTDIKDHDRTINMLELAHRGADAVIHATPGLAPMFTSAFSALAHQKDAWPLCCLSPTSLVFGVWDSRGQSNEKLPRIVRSIIRAWDVEPLTSAAQFNSIWKRLDENTQAELRNEEAKKAIKSKLSEVGLQDTPAVFQRPVKKARESRVRVLGGVVVNGRIVRHCTINLVALRRLRSSSDDQTSKLRNYILSLALIAATSDTDLYLREGCNLCYAEDAQWSAISRTGEPTLVDLASTSAKQLLLSVATRAVKPFMRYWPKESLYDFDVDAAKTLLSKKSESDED